MKSRSCLMRIIRAGGEGMNSNRQHKQGHHDDQVVKETKDVLMIKPKRIMEAVLEVRAFR